MQRSQLGAIPCTLTTRLAADRNPALFTTFGSGARDGTGALGADAAEHLREGAVLASSRRNSENIVLAGVGMNLSSVCSARESFTCWSTTGNEDAVSTEPITQAISSIDSMLTTDPPTESRAVDERQVTVDRIAAPTEEATNCPITAKLTSRTTATTSCWVWPPTMAREMAGPNSAPSSAPPTKPTKLSTPTMKPCR